ncbi:hypothetical protein CNECB9_3140012 [Cupriavidus necator]|uniref:Uncharacterized protein n=1 Tax=Cupriavidus necator TaxID=106590 RepID=A0A1K0ITZ5_CUPNE|nr:hypothetical protein CNECB9_3140012 [Cupriavidus necator]
MGTGVGQVSGLLHCSESRAAREPARRDASTSKYPSGPRIGANHTIADAFAGPFGSRPGVISHGRFPLLFRPLQAFPQALWQAPRALSAIVAG